MTDHPQSKIDAVEPAWFPPVFWLILAVILMPWAWIQAGQAVHSDLLWLSEAFLRVLDGHRMSDFIYETNPPFNLFTYALPVLFAEATGTPIHSALFAYSCGLVILSAWFVHAILRGWAFIGRNDARVATGFFVLLNTISIATQFGERDQYLGMFLVPFLLIQVAMTYRLPLPRGMKWPVLLLGALFIMLKPHHGLIPTILLIHRMLVQRRFITIIRDADFIALASMVLIYVGVAFFFFRDYLTNILPDVLMLYLPMGDKFKAMVHSLLFSYTIIVVGATAFIPPMARARRNLALFLAGAAILSIIPYYIQGLSFKYHLYPAVSLAACSLAIIIMAFLEWAAPRWRGTAIAALCAFASLCYVQSPLNPDYPTHRDYAELPLTRVLEPCIAEKSCTFLFLHLNMGIIHETAHYTGLRHASRFPTLWFLPTLLKMEKDPDVDPGTIDRLRREFIGYMSEDIIRHKPLYAIVFKESTVDGVEVAENIDFLGYFLKHPDFRAAWSQYEKVDTLTLGYHQYFTKSPYDNGTILTYDVYRLKPE